jgi:hypothetical protein
MTIDLLTYKPEPELPKNIVQKYGKCYSIDQFSKDFDCIDELHLDNDNLYFNGKVINKNLLRDLFSNDRQGKIYLCKLNLKTGEFHQKETIDYNSQMFTYTNIYTDRILVFTFNEIRIYSKSDLSLICVKQCNDGSGHPIKERIRVFYSKKTETFAYSVITIDQNLELHSDYLDGNLMPISKSKLNGYKDVTKKLEYFSHYNFIILENNKINLYDYCANDLFICGLCSGKLYVFDRKAMKNNLPKNWFNAHI